MNSSFLDNEFEAAKLELERFMDSNSNSNSKQEKEKEETRKDMKEELNPTNQRIRLEKLQVQIDFLSVIQDFALWEERLKGIGYYSLRSDIEIVNPHMLNELKEMMSSLFVDQNQFISYFEYMNDNPSIQNSNNVFFQMKQRYQYLYFHSRYSIQQQIRSLLRSFLIQYPTMMSSSSSSSSLSNTTTLTMKKSNGWEILQENLLICMKKYPTEKELIQRYDYQFHDLISCIIYLIHLDLIHQPIASLFDLSTTNQSSRLYIIDELCRPIAERIVYHFSTTITPVPLSVPVPVPVPVPLSKDSISNKMKPNNIENKVLTEHLLSYIKTIIKQPLIFIVKAIHPFINHLSTNFYSSTKIEAISYFLTQMIHLAYHILQERKVFHDLWNKPSFFINAMEQILTFDQLICDSINQIKNNPNSNPNNNNNNNMQRYEISIQQSLSHPPRLINLLLQSTPNLLQKWLTIEWKGASHLLSMCEKQIQTIEDDDFFDKQEEQPLEIPSRMEKRYLFLPSNVEVFLSLYHSFESKYNLITNANARDSIVKMILVPLSMQYLEQLHFKAKQLMTQLQLWSTNQKLSSVMNDKKRMFQDIMFAWFHVLNGANLIVTFMNTTTNNNQPSQEPIIQTDDLKRVGQSLQKLLDAMIDECVSYIVENIIMEKAKLTMYLMQCPHLLSLKEITTKDNLTLDLMDTLHLLSIVIKSCYERLKYNEEYRQYKYQTDGALMNMFHFGPNVILSTLAMKISTKFSEIILDELQVFEIRTGGAYQFQYDVETFMRLFDNQNGNEEELSFRQYDHHAHFQKLRNLIYIMTMDWHAFVSLKRAMHGLCHNRSTSSLLDDDFILSIDNFIHDEIVMNEAMSMLAAKKLDSMDLSDVLSIMNRRIG